MSSSDPGIPDEPELRKRYVRGLFGPIAARYDLADTVLSAGRDDYWRRTAIRSLGLQPGERVLDACGGTGGLAVPASRRIGPRGRVVVWDFSREMTAVGRARTGRRPGPAAGRVLFVRGDVEDLGVAGASFDAAMIGFGLRNLARPERGLAELFRALKPGGRLVILEFALPVWAFVRRLYDFYSYRVMPVAGGLLAGTPSAYRYLADSIRRFPGPEAVAAMARAAGFESVAVRRLTGGIAAVTTGRRPGGASRRGGP